MFDAIIDGSIVDTRFVHCSTCRADLGGSSDDVEWDIGPGVLALENLYTALIDGGKDHYFDSDFHDYDPGDEDVYLRGVLEATSLYALNAAESVTSDINAVQEPFVRLGLLSIAVGAADTVWFDGGSGVFGGPLVVVDLFALGCTTGRTT